MEVRPCKKLLSLLLVFLLALSAALPVSAAQGGSDAELEQVTRSVKKTLDLDTDDYTDFSGDYEAWGADGPCGTSTGAATPAASPSAPWPTAPWSATP